MGRAVGTILSMAIIILGLLAAPALASRPPVVGTPVSEGVRPHMHHVLTGAGCTDINAVSFFATDAGLHQGASASAKGPNHGPCPTT